MSCPRKSSGGRWWRSKALFRVALLLGLIWFLWVGVLENEAARLNGKLLAGGGSEKQEEMTGKRVPIAQKNLEINFVSKRKVPNGPDPIHNRFVCHHNVHFIFFPNFHKICMLTLLNFDRARIAVAFFYSQFLQINFFFSL